MITTEQPVIQQESWPDVRLYQVGDKIYAVGEKWAAGFFRQKLDYHYFLTIRNGRVVENMTPSIEISADHKPLLVLGVKLKPRLSEVENNIVKNLTHNRPELRKYDGWQIAMAQSGWAVSEDYPDESKVIDWIPDVTADNIIEFQQNQIGNLSRSINDLETYITQLTRDKGDLQRRVDNYMTELQVKT